MARTLSCADVGYDCAYRLITENGDDDFILDTTIAHAKKHHPEIAGNEHQLKEKLRGQIKDLLDQSGYHEPIV
jgi:predicted small metal-binding protein